jgi:predicted site-specific integrase-resolvase
MQLFTTAQAATKAKITRVTLQNWIAAGHVIAPPVQLVNGRAMRVWSESDVEKIKAFRGTLRPGRVPKKKSVVDPGDSTQ